MAKDSRFQHAYRRNASKLHRKVGDLLRESDEFKNYDCFQEYPVNKIDEDYHTGSHKFDWVIPSLQVVIECHGRQHYEVVAFDGNVDNAVIAFQETKSRDKSKMHAAMSAGYRYLVVPYTREKTVTAEMILDMIKVAQEELEAFQEEHKVEIEQKEEAKENALQARLAVEKKEREREAREKYLASQQHQRELKKAREFRQKRYRRLKELKNGSR